MSGRFWTFFTAICCIVVIAQFVFYGVAVVALYEVGRWLLHLSGVGPS